MKAVDIGVIDGPVVENASATTMSGSPSQTQTTVASGSTLPGRSQSKATIWIAALVTVSVLYLAREVLVPIALAILLTFLLAPLANRFRKWGIGRIPSVITAVILGLMIIASIGGVVTLQLLDLAESLPEYRENIEAKFKSISSHTRFINDLERFGETIRAKSTEIEKPEKLRADSVSPTQASERPVPVEVRSSAPSSLEILKSVSGSVWGPVAKSVIVIVFLVFMLLQREDLRDRFLLLLGANQLNLTTQVLDDAAARVSRYLVMQCVVNASYGIPIGVGLYFLGIPNALIWGLLAGLLRFIPYVGAVIAASFPIALAFAIDPGWTRPILTGGLFVVVELMTNNLLEPWLYGTSTGLSPFAIIVAAVFWTWLWGPLGLFLSTPLTVCLAVIGRHVPNLQFLHVLLADTPQLSDQARFYQRLLARKDEEAMELADKIVAAHSLDYLYDHVIIPALSLAEQDRHQGTLEERSEKFVLENTREIVEEFGPIEPAQNMDTSVPIAVLCIPANDFADELCATMLMQLLSKKGVRAKVLSASSLTTEYLDAIRVAHPKIICVSALPPAALRHARLFCKRLRAEFPNLKIVLGVWTHESNSAPMRNRLSNIQIDHVVTSLDDALKIIHPLA